MSNLLNRFRNIFKGQREPLLDAQDLEQAFTERYRHFRRLLTANNNALQAMADLEKIYYSGESYRMAAVRSKVTAILVNVYKMIRELRELSGGKYAELENRFDFISKEIEAVIERKPDPPKGPSILPLTEVSRKIRDLTGDKMANLAEAANVQGITIPQGFVLTAAATNYFITQGHLAEMNRRLQILDPDDMEGLYATCDELQQMIINTPLPADLEELLQLHYANLEKKHGEGCLVALRSSALGEDSTGISFAGLYTTILNVDRDHLAEAYKKVIAGKYGPKAIAYRRRRGFRHEDIEMCVGCLAMVNANVSGVAYSTYPAAAGPTVRIVATQGLGSGVVEGSAQSQTYLVNREEPHLFIEEIAIPTPGLLSEQMLAEIAHAALLLENHFEGPQDVEWSFDQEGKLYILQSRPVLIPAEQKELIAPENIVKAGEQPTLLNGGVCASGGIACGPVYHIRTKEDMHTFPKGGIMVVEYPLPDWAPLLGRAGAILAEHGSEAGHLATVAREFSLPAIFGLPGLLATLPEGKEITVNCSERKIFPGCCKTTLAQMKPPRDVMAGSPVQRLTTDALRHITPLNLNDPAAIQFKPSYCETLHDITRFCHEKSVTEMFNFGDRFSFNTKMAKRLVAKVPLEWWIVNLANGIREGAVEDQKSIHLDDIVSVPMLAVWRGISYSPWQGPPPISARGFGSILLQSAMRPELDPAVGSAMNTKNYFLISKNFCNLSVRLGYHYAMVESYISDFLTESYITFRFKGGAADMRRKAVRVRLLADVLREYDFRIELQADILLARIKRQPREYLEKRLQVLGYLITHSRQIDMVMDQKGAVKRYEEKFLKEIDEMLSTASV
ncbi:MAG: PEP/pyruvate-binding domain-containing protein [Desulfocapsaceae bacterium]|nr:PEP/pyruvate-binding domain-containing protein [Desulfocapsaceae bacterium]